MNSLTELVQNENHTILIDREKSDEPIQSVSNYGYVNFPCNDRIVWSRITQILTELKENIQKYPKYSLLKDAIQKCSQPGSIKNLNTIEILFNKSYDQNESENKLKYLIPKMVDLALSLPDKIKNKIPILKQGKTHSITLTSEQCAVILSNSFFCTLCDPKNEKMRFLSFGSLFEDFKKETKIEKLKCFMNYFERISEQINQQKRIITFSRISNQNFEENDFKKSNKKIIKPKIHSNGVIEDAEGAIQVDFANKYIGGGVLGGGCVQEEIRFSICPELIVSRLFMERMDQNECIFIRGSERFSNYDGYGRSFLYAGNHQDSTKKEKMLFNGKDYDRILTDVLAIDALHFTEPNSQFTERSILREIVKSYTGFCANPYEQNDSKIIATGNWGCGAFRGDFELKFLIQLMSASQAGKDLAYFTFNDRNTFEKLNQISDLLTNSSSSIEQIYKLLINFCTNFQQKNLFSYLKNNL